MKSPPTLIETVHARITLFGSGSVFCRVSYQDRDPDNDLEFNLVLRSDDSLGDAVDECARLLAGWAAVGRLGMSAKGSWRVS